MVKDVIKLMNREFKDLFSKYPGIKIYGLTQQLIKQTGSETIVIPAQVDVDGEGKWVGVDDVAPLIIYHKTISPMSVLRKPGYGDMEDIFNTYNQALIVYFDRSRICLTADEVQRFVQVRIPTSVRFDDTNFKSIRVNVVSVQMNSQLVYQTEYQDGKILDPKFSMVQINYQIESRFSRACFATCP